MLLSRKTLVSTLVIVLAATVLGCSEGPTPITVPSIQVEEAADAAFSQYDKDGDGQLNEEELSECPAFQDAMAYNIDKNKDRQLSKDELTEKLSNWSVSEGIGLSPLSCRVTMKGRPLAGAHVKFVPEDFLGGAIQPAVGTTGPGGTARLSIDPAHLPEDLQNVLAMQQGHYRVKIIHPSTEIPAKYNTETTLGVEISFGRGRRHVGFKL